MKFYISTALNGNENYSLIDETIKKSKINIGIEYFLFEANEKEIKLLKNIHNEFLDAPASLHSPMINAEPTADDNSVEEQQLYQSWEEALKLCNIFGSKQIVFHTNNCNINECDRLEKQANCMRNALKLNTLCKKHGVTMLIETLGLPSRGASIFNEKEFVDFVNNNDLYALIDIGHMNLNGYSYEFIVSNLNNRIKAYHIHNNDGMRDSHDIFDRGSFNYKKFANLYKMYTPNADLTIEYIDVSDLTAQRLINDIELLRNMIKK